MRAGGDGRSSQSAEADRDLESYQQVAASLEARIESGALGPGDQLPPFSVLAAQHDVSFGTVQRAVSRLRELGLVTVRRGRRAIVVDRTAS